MNDKALTIKQRTILNLFYRFRFVTSDQLSQALSITKATTNKRLKLLLEQNYIERKYDRISREHAVYYLSANGIQTLKQISKDKYLPKVLRNIKHDSGVSDQFVKHNLAVLDVYNNLRAQCGDKLQFFTKTQMAAVPYFPKQLPDAHIQLQHNGTNKLFLLDILHQDQPFFRSTRAIFRYMAYAAQGEGWPDQYEFPKILLVCDGAALQKRLMKKMRHTLEDHDDERLQVYITTVKELKSDEWHSIAEPDEALTLRQI